MYVEILDFFIRYHKKNKNPYIKVKVRFLDGFRTHVNTFVAKDFLGVYFTNKNFLETFLKKLLTKIVNSDINVLGLF